ncbi:hypothetical protein WJX84_002893 [Apatococcus fuscideae]|uniref:CSE family protein n=1 Tax=Apatococcus fuscideae TaxID=2026836 RepID=A0AAW1SLN6_9CHLO
MGEQEGVRLPPELQGVPTQALEEYVRVRLIQFAGAFARRVKPNLSQQAVQLAAAEAIASLPPPELGRVAIENRDLQLVFRHDCLSLGCLDPQCVLCEHNPHRRCNVNFAPKYLVNDVLKAKCDAPIRIEVIDRSTGVPLGEDIPDVHLEMSILDGNAYDNKCLETGQERDDDLDACSLLLNNKIQPLLAPGNGGAHNAGHKVTVGLSRGMALLPDLHVSDSSEAMLSGRKPPFRLLVRAVHADGHRLNVRHAVSEGFVVATRRTRTAGKVEIPNVEDHVSKLEHMGKETVKKLQDITGAAVQSGLEISVPDNTINRVGEFRKLALMAEADGHLRQKLQQVLKLSKEKWDDARDHAMRAVVADNRMRIWYVDKQQMELGLLFTCRLGNCDLDRPVGLLQKKGQDGTQTTMEATLTSQQTPGQREQVRQLQPQAVNGWWQPGHPGWAIYPVDSDSFMNTGALDNVAVLHDHIVAPLPPSPAHIQGHQSPPYPSLPSYTNPGKFMDGQGMPSSPYMPGPSAPLLSRPPPIASAADGAVDMDGLQQAQPPGHLPQQPSQQQQSQHQPPSSSMQDGYSSGFRPPSRQGQPGPLGLEPPLPGSITTAPRSGAGGSERTERSSGRHRRGDPPGRAGNAQPGTSLAADPAGTMHSRQLDPSPFASLSGKQGSGSDFNALSQAFCSGPLSSSDLQSLHASGILGPLPSLPGPIPSGDLEKLLGGYGTSWRDGSMGRSGSFGMGKLESLELPDAVAAVAMLHDMPPEQRAGHMPPLPRSNSGLESMQSIEQALGNVEGDVMDKVAQEWMTQNAQQQQQQPHQSVPASLQH